MKHTKGYVGACALLVLVWGLAGHDLMAQTSTISGYVEDAGSGERIPGAALYIPALGTGAVSNQYGFYSLSVDTPTIQFVVSHVAYESVPFDLTLQGDTTLLIVMAPRTVSLEEVAVVAEGESALEDVQMSVHEVQIDKIEGMPVLLGEVDIQKVLQLLPGVQTGTEGTTGLYVRGGRGDQNLILVDGIPLYNPVHLFGFISVFNAPAMKRVEFIKGGFPARYGGRLASVVNYTMKEGNLRKIAGEASIGLISSRVVLEGPIKQDKASFLIAARRSYADVLAAPFISGEDSRYVFYFYDINAKANAILSKRDRIYLSAFAGQDKFGLRENYGSDRVASDFGWHNRLVSLRWNHQISDRMFVNTLLGVTNYQLQINGESIGRDGSRDVARYWSEIIDRIGKVDFEYAHSLRHYVRFGVELVSHHFNPGTFFEEYGGSDGPAEVVVQTAEGKLPSSEGSIYAEDEIRLTDGIRATVGLRFAVYRARKATYTGIEPRIAANFRIDETMAAKLSWGMGTQFVHLLTQGAVTLPTDLWVPTLEEIEPQRGSQAAVGVVKTLGDDANYEISAEAYYKRLQNLLEYGEGAGWFESVVLSWPDLIESGSGEAYGLELLLRKKAGRLTGWIGYTLARATRTFEHLNRGDPFPDNFDRRHDLAVVGQYNLSRNILASVNWIYGSGYPFWIPSGRFRATSVFNYSDRVLEYGPVNSARIPASHRLDVSMQIRRERVWATHTFAFGFYNVYAQQNPFFIYFDEFDSNFRQVSFLTLVPSFSYQIQF